MEKREESREKDPRNGRQSKRIAGKLLISFLGLFLLLAIFMRGGGPEQENKHGNEPEVGEPTPEAHIPVIRELHNVRITEIGEDNLLLYHDGVEECYYYGVYEADGELYLYQPEWDIREQIADVELRDDMVTKVRVKKEKIHGVILSADDSTIEVEGYGRLQLAEDFRGYRVYNTPAMCTQRDLAFGYDFADLVLDNGEICALLMVREESMENIRVLIKTSDYGGNLHGELMLTADTDYVIRYGTYDAAVEEYHGAGEEVVIARDSAYFTGDRVLVEPLALTGRISLKNVERSQGVPAYRGHMELLAEPEGFAVVNVLPLEEYLYSVVPSEMPASYPIEALKAQAICARTYAYRHIMHAAYPLYGAHVDDSTAYQVYNNVAEQKNTTTAVKETYGQLLYTENGEPTGTYYYSTSCGVGSTADVWKTEEAAAITYLKAKSINEAAVQNDGDFTLGEELTEENRFAEYIRRTDPEDYEAEEGWYRWSYQVKKLDAAHMCEVLKKRYDANNKLVLTLKKGSYVSSPIKDFKKVKDLYILKRLPGGVADEMIVETDSGTYKVITEHNIRYVLCDGETKAALQNGKKVSMPNLLPSGFFVIKAGKEKGCVVGYTLTGGGFGHGVGMSQNAAKAMAAKGLTCEEILLFFYDSCLLQQLYP